ncbi:hypothetical protein [uncultured Clostridium sp.]
MEPIDRSTKSIKTRFFVEYALKRIERFNMNYVTTIEMSEIWGISARRIALLCEQGRIAGVVKKGKTWLIPEDAEKPADKRKNDSIEL